MGVRLPAKYSDSHRSVRGASKEAKTGPCPTPPLPECPGLVVRSHTGVLIKHDNRTFGDSRVEIREDALSALVEVGVYVQE